MNKESALGLLSALEKKTTMYDSPFRLGVVDDFLPFDNYHRLLAAFPDKSDSTWETSIISNVEQKRRSTWKSLYDIPEGISDVVAFLNSSIFLSYLSEKLQIPKLMPDPYFSGGGLNESFRGDFLDVHVDGNYHDASGLNRRVNAILYLTPNWKSEWGGRFGMYTEDGKSLVRDFSPLGNRLVFFDTSDASFHGFPEPITCPEDISRKSLILYYYTKEAQVKCENTVEQPHSALWVKKGIRDKNNQKTREFY